MGTRPRGEKYAGSVGGIKFEVSKEMTRPSDTSPYTAGDVVSNDTTTTVDVKVNTEEGGDISGCEVEVDLVFNTHKGGGIS